MNLNSENVTTRPPLTRHPSGSAETAEEAVNNILYKFSSNVRDNEERHILSVLVDNEIGILSKVSGLLSSRGFNIDSLSVSKTDVKDLSRMTIVLNGNHIQMEQAKRQLQDLCDVWTVFDYIGIESVLQRELCLVKVSTLPPEIQLREADNTDQDNFKLSYDEIMACHFHKQAIIDIAKQFNATVEDIGSKSIVLQLVTWPRRTEAFLKILKPFKIIEAARSGIIAMNRSKVIDQTETKKEIKHSSVDLSELPPS